MPAKGSMKASAMRRASVLVGASMVLGPAGVQALGGLPGGEAVSRGVEQHEGVLGAMGCGKDGVLGKAGVSGRARRAAALGDDFEYRGGFEHQHRVLLVKGS